MAKNLGIIIINDLNKCILCVRKANYAIIQSVNIYLHFSTINLHTYPCAPGPRATQAASADACRVRTTPAPHPARTMGAATKIWNSI